MNRKSNLRRLSNVSPVKISDKTQGTLKELTKATRHS